MIVPQYWAESRVQHRQNGRQVTVRRFGWSDTSLADAQANADARASDALKRRLSGEGLRPREPKVPYNGAEGVPIREEIIERHGNVIITRNGYGAWCLNTPNVLFADVDFNQGTPIPILYAVSFIMIIAWIVAGWLAKSKGIGLILSIFVSLMSGAFTGWLLRRIRRAKGGEETQVRFLIHGFLAKHPEWSLRLYRTPAGMRVLATHRTFDPNEPDVAEFFKAIGADPLYALMCRNQHCFRARVTAKPWRIGIPDHMRPRPGVWPVAPERLAIRNAWIQRYEAAARDYAACTFLGTVGADVIQRDTAPVQELHDRLSRASGGRPIA